MLSIKDLSALYAAKYNGERLGTEPKGLYEPMSHIMSIPGKRIRPLLLLLSCDAFGGQVSDALNAAHAMELFHNFTLVHDDIMDAATLRRGIPTVHELYGINAGILTGDAIFIYVYKYLCMLPPAILPAALELFNATAVEIMEGQQMDMDFEQRLDVAVQEYLTMIGFKTSVLLACSLQMGAIIAGASVHDQSSVYDFGMKLGLSFQIKDDWLDTFGESDKVGKKPGGDIIQNKKTYLLITLLNTISNDDRKELLKLFEEKDETHKVAAVMALYAKYDISAKTLEKADALYQEALDALDAISISTEQKVNLRTMAQMVHDRTF